MVPLLASSNFPGLARTAPVNAIHFDEGLIAALRAQVNHARYDFFSDAAFAANEYRHVDRGDLQNLLANAHHLRAGRKETQILGHLIAIIAERLILLRHVLFLARLQHGRVEVALFEGLGQIVVRADADRFHYGANLIRAAQHDDVQAAVELQEFFQGVDAVHFGHQHIQDDEVRPLAVADLADDFLTGADGLDIESVHLQERLQIFADTRLIIDDKNLFFYGH